MSTLILGRLVVFFALLVDGTGIQAPKCTMAVPMENCLGSEKISEMVQHLCVETSDKFVFEPTKLSQTENMLHTLKRFRNACRWKEFFRMQRQKKQTIVSNESETETTVDGGTNESLNKDKLDEGLGTGLRSSKKKAAPKGSDQLE